MAELDLSAFDRIDRRVEDTIPPKVDTPTQPAGARAPADSLPYDMDPSLMQEFIAECHEFIDSAEAALLSLEADPDDGDAVNTIFRAFHTIKGASGFLGLTLVSELAHRAESLLTRIREHEVRYRGEYADLALRSVDMLKHLVRAAQEAMSGKPLVRPDGYDDLLRRLDDSVVTSISSESDRPAYLSGPLSDSPATESKADPDGQPVSAALPESGAGALTDVDERLRTPPGRTGNEPLAEASVRVRTDRLDRLIDMVGELVIAHSMVAHDKFEQEALESLAANPQKTFYRLENYQGVPSMRYVSADIMVSNTCVTCHNTHPASPKTDWRLGDVRGALEVIIPVDRALADARAGAMGKVISSPSVWTRTGSFPWTMMRTTTWKPYRIFEVRGRNRVIKDTTWKVMGTLG